MIETRAYAAFDATSPLRPYSFTRREPGSRDVEIEILFCGICHSDVHQARNEWHGSVYPMVPGHEIVGKVARVGSAVKGFRVGERVGVGCLVNSCGTCAACTRGDEQYCLNGPVFTYNSPDRDGTRTQGGYSTRVVVDEKFVLRVPESIAPEAAAPLLCAGVTTFSPLRRWKVAKGQRVAVVGLGGLGHMGVKLAAAIGAEVTLISTSEKKRADAKRLGATDFLLSSDASAIAAARDRFDFILDTVSAPHDLSALLSMTALDGALVLVGAPPVPVPVAAFSLINKRLTLAGSLIGGIRETQEMLDFCAAHKLGADVEVIAASQVNEAYERMLRSDVKYRFVIDASSLRN